MDARSLTEFEQAIRKLKRSKLTWTPEFNDMLLAIERFQRDGSLDSLTRKSKSEFIHRLEDAQFFSILLGMLTEISRSSGLKQRDDLRKVYHWYQMNKDVLHCQPHFQSVSSSSSRTPAPGSKTSKKHGTPRSGSTLEDSVSRENAQNRLLSRPETAPPGLNRLKAGDTSLGIRKSWRGQQMFVGESGVSLSYIDSHLTPQKYLAALDRPATAQAIFQHSKQAGDPRRSETGSSNMEDGELGERPSVDDRGFSGDPKGDGEVETNRVESEKTNKQEDESPGADDEGHSLHRTNLQKWHRYQQNNNSYHGNSFASTNQEDPFRMEAMMVEMPELNTDQVITEFAESTPLKLQDQAHYDTSQSLEDFYEESDKYGPSVNPKKSTLSKVSKQRDSSRSDEKTGHSPNAVRLESVVDLAGLVSDQMVLDKELQGELVEPRLRHRSPATEVPPLALRSGSAEGPQGGGNIIIPDGCNFLASTPRSNRSVESELASVYAGDAMIGYPVKSDYTVHFKKETRPFTAPMNVFQGSPRHVPIQPDTTRYRSKSASPRISLRTAGTTSGGGRPRSTSSRSSLGHKQANKTKVLVPGAASHSSSTIHPLTISSMMSVRYLGGTSTNFRENLNHNAGQIWNSQNIPDDLPPNLEFMTFTGPAPFHDTASDAKSVPEEAPLGNDTIQRETAIPATSLEKSDSIKGLVHMGRAQSERGAGDAESHDGVSSGANSDRGVSPPPGDLSDVDDNDIIEGTPREGERSVGTGKGEMVGEGRENDIDDEMSSDEGIIEGREGEVLEGEAENRESVDKTSRKSEGVILYGSAGEGEVVDGIAGEVELSDETAGEESELDMTKREGVSVEGTACDGTNIGVVANGIPLEGKISDDSESEGANVDESAVDGEKNKGTQGVKNAHGTSAEGGGMVNGRVGEGEPMKDTSSLRVVSVIPSQESYKEGDPVVGAIREGEPIHGTAREEDVDTGTAREQGTTDVNIEEKRLDRPESRARSISESFGDEDYYEFPYQLYDDDGPYVRSPQVVIPKVRDPNGQLLDAKLDLEAAVKPLTPRDKGRDEKTVTICGTRVSGRRSERSDGSVYLLAEEEPSNAEQSETVAADVRKKPLWEREWMRAWRRYNRRTDEDVATPYRLRLLEDKHKSSCNQGQSQTTVSEDGTPKITPRRPQTPKRFEALEPKPQKPIRDEWRGRPLPDVISNLDEDAERKAFKRKKAAKQAVRISELFSREADKELDKMKKQLEWGRWAKRWEEADAAERNHLRDQLRREAALSNRSSEVIDDTWEKQYSSQRKSLKQRKTKELKDELRRKHRKSKQEKEYLGRVAASLDIWDIYREGRRGTTKGDRKKAAIIIQKRVRGWLARRQFEKIKQKSRVHATSYNQFADYYSKFMTKVARWHGVKSPSIHIDLKEVDDFMDKKRYYETMFAKAAYPKKTLEYDELGEFFKSCDLYPTQREMHNAVLAVTKQLPDDPHMGLTEEQISEIAFMIYVPDGSRLDKSKTRQSTWLNPLINGKEASKFIGSKEYHEAKLSISMRVVFDAHRERMEREGAARRQEDDQLGDDSRAPTLTEGEHKKRELEQWIKNEEVREQQEEERRNRPIREGELVTNYQTGDIGLLEELGEHGMNQLMDA